MLPNFPNLAKLYWLPTKHPIQEARGANQAVASSRAGTPTQMLGAVGDDQIGDDLLRTLAGYSVGVKDVRTLSGLLPDKHILLCPK